MRKKVNASTLMEVLIAMVIIMIVFSIAIAIYGRISNSGVSVNQAKAGEAIEAMIRQTVSNRNYKDEEFDRDGIHYTKTLNAYKEQDDLLQITISAEQNGKILAVHKQVILIKDED